MRNNKYKIGNRVFCKINDVTFLEGTILWITENGDYDVDFGNENFIFRKIIKESQVIRK